MRLLPIRWFDVSWVFFVNVISFVAVFVALLAMHSEELHRVERRPERPRIREGLAHARSIPEIRSTIVLVAVVGTLVYNFPTFLTMLARDTFRGDAGLAGFLMALLGIGTVSGALVAAHRRPPNRSTVLVAAAMLGAMMMIAVASPSRLLIEICLVPLGACAVFFGSSANAHLQISSAFEFRGRVMAIYTMLTLGTTVLGGPFSGWVCQQWSPRIAIGFAGSVTLSAAAVLGVVSRRGNPPVSAATRRATTA